MQNKNITYIQSLLRLVGHEHGVTKVSQAVEESTDQLSQLLLRFAGEVTEDMDRLVIDQPTITLNNQKTNSIFPNNIS